MVDMDAFKFERVFVQVVEEIAAKKGLNGAQLARLAWPHQKSSAAAWRKMRNNQESPKRLNIEEAVLLTQAIGLSMADVCGIVQARMMEISIAPPKKSEPPTICIDKLEHSTPTTLPISEENFARDSEKIR